jgi:hypothetical protein
MSTPSSPLSEHSDVFEVDHKIVKMIVSVIMCQHGILHYHAQTWELTMFQWSDLFCGKEVLH